MPIDKVLKPGFAGLVLTLVATAAYVQGRGVARSTAPALPSSAPASNSIVVPPPCKAVASPVPTAFHEPPPGVVDPPAPPTRVAPNPTPLLRSLRVVPEQQDGKLVGLRLFGIRSGSLLGTLGLQNGDRLESINGFNVASPEKALEAYARLRTATHLSIRVVRIGKPLEIDLNII